MSYFPLFRPCFAHVVHVGLLSIIPRGFGGNTSDIQSPLFLRDPLPPNIRTQNHRFAWRGRCRPDAREEGDRCSQNAKTRDGGSASFPPVPDVFPRGSMELARSKPACKTASAWFIVFLGWAGIKPTKPCQNAATKRGLTGLWLLQIFVCRVIHSTFAFYPKKKVSIYTVQLCTLSSFLAT
jgi:hypothetical protein